MTKENFQVDLRGIVEILSHHLYSGPRVYVRELIQNARDAVVARVKIEPGLLTRLGDRPPIGITIDEPARAVLIHDHGIGLTEEDARNLLATIGASSKRQEFEAARREYLGQFGIGLLSCFLVSDEIEVRSRSARDPNSPTMRWVGYGDGTFTVTEDEHTLPEPGTQIRVRARPDEAEWVSGARVRLLAEQFARLLPYAITVRTTPEHQEPVLVSTQTPPWELAPEASARWCQAEFGSKPLASIPIDVPAYGVHGVAFVSSTSIGSRKRGGDVVFSHGMFVAADNTQLVPDWATFAHAALEAGSLGLTASREALQDSTSVDQVRDDVGRQVRAGIERLASQSPEPFDQFVRVHGESLLAMATVDEHMLDFVARHLYWETSAGDLRLAAMPRRVIYAETLGDFNTYAPLLAARGELLVNGAYTNGAKVLRAYREAQARLRLDRFDLDSVLDGLPQPRDEDRDLAVFLRTVAEPVLDEFGTALELRGFSPESLMVLHIPKAHSAFEFEDVKDDPWAGMLGGGADPGREAKDLRPKLVLNLRSTAVRAIAGSLDPSTRTDAIRALYLLSLLQGGQRLNASDQGALAAALQTLLLAASTNHNES